MSELVALTESREHRPAMLPYGMMVRVALALLLLGAIAYAASSWRTMREAAAAEQVSEQGVIRAIGIVEPKPKHLASVFTDSQDTLLADPPKDPAQFQDPSTIVFAHIDSDAETRMVDWAGVEKDLAEATGLKVEDRIFDNSPAQLADVKAGKITVLALHPADTPFLVNEYGFRPVAMLGEEGGDAAGNRLDLIVPAGSPLIHAADVRGHFLTCSEPTSITGYRAAVALLMQNEQLRPNIDYFVIWSLKMKGSIKGIVGKKFEVAAVSDDKLQSMLAKGTVQESQFRVIYRSEVIPRTTVGTFHKLKPELAGKIRDALLSSRPAGTSDSDESSKPTRFLPVDYKKDFALLREIDDRFEPRLNTRPNKPKKSAAPTTSAQ